MEIVHQYISTETKRNLSQLQTTISWESHYTIWTYSSHSYTSCLWGCHFSLIRN